MAITRLGGANAITGVIPVANGGTNLSSGFVNGGVATPAFSAIKSSQTTGQTDATWTKITYDTELLDSDAKFADSRFTPTVA